MGYKQGYKQNSNTKKQTGNDSSRLVLPLSNHLKQLLETPDCNFSLVSPRMVTWKLTKDKSGKYDFKTDENVIPALFEKSILSYKNITKYLQKKNSLQNSYLKAQKESGLQVFSFRAKLTAPFVTGLGSGHPTETGMILDRNTGVPYIPASSIKGVMRVAYAINIAEGRGEVADSELTDFFGGKKVIVENGVEKEKDFRGQLVFLDAYPIDKVNLDVDIINPHYGAYYRHEKNEQPVETESPKPVKFLAVKKGTEYNFRCIYVPFKDEKCNEDVIEAMFKTAFTTVGFGSKTAIGYGRFKII